jgi:hypothetical protein
MTVRMPIGFREKGHGPKVAVIFPEELFEQIKVRATKENKTYSAMVCELCRVGLFDLDESDACEVKEIEHAD